MTGRSTGAQPQPGVDRPAAEGEVHTSRPAGRRAAVATETGLVLVGAWVLATIITWPLLFDLDGRVFGRFGDSLGTIWSLWRDSVEGFHPFGTRSIETLGAPLGFTRNAWQDLLGVAIGLPGWLLTEITNEVVAYNLLVLSGLALSGAAMYWLARVLGAGPLPAAWAGIVFTLFPWHLERAAGSASQAHLEVLPLIVLAGIWWRRSPSWRPALAFAAVLLGGLMTDPYVALMSVITALCVVVGCAWDRLRAEGLGASARRTAPLALAAAVPPVVLFGVLYASRGAGDSAEGLARPASDLVTYGGRLHELVIPTYGSRLFGDWTDDYLGARLHQSNFSETSLYLGWVTIGLAAAFLVVCWARRGRLHAAERLGLRLGGLLVVAGLLMTLVSPLDLGPIEVPLPAEAIFDVAPYWRVFSRFVAVVMLGVVVLAVLALRRTEAWRPRALAVAVPLVAIVASVAELWSSPPIGTVELPSPAPAYELLARTDRATPVAAYPLVRSDEALNSTHLYWQRVHRHPLLNGAPIDTRPDDLREGLVSLADPATLPALAYLGVDLVVVEGPPVAVTGLAPMGAEGATATAYRVQAAPADGVAFLREGAGRAEVDGEGRTRRWLGRDGVMEVDVPRAGRYRLTFTAGSYRTERRLTLATGSQRESFDVAGERALRASFDLPAGSSLVDLRVAPGPEPLADGRLVSVSLGTPVVTAERG